MKRAKQYGGLHHSTGIVSSAADELRGEKRQQVERDMHAWQQRVDSLHRRQQQQLEAAGGKGEAGVQERVGSKRQRVDEGGPPVKRALFGSEAVTRMSVSELESSRLASEDDKEAAEEEEEEDVSGVEVMQDDAAVDEVVENATVEWEKDGVQKRGTGTQNVEGVGLPLTASQQSILRGTAQ